MTDETKVDYNQYSIISKNLQTISKEGAQKISLADYERQFNVKLGQRGRSNLSAIKSKMRKDGETISRPAKVGPVPRMEPNAILCTLPVGEIHPEMIVHMKRLLPGLLETALKKMGGTPPPLKVVQVEEDGQETVLEVRSK